MTSLGILSKLTQKGMLVSCNHKNTRNSLNSSMLKFIKMVSIGAIVHHILMTICGFNKIWNIIWVS